MSAWSRLAAGAMLLGLVEATACNSVLGIEEAELNTTPLPECHSGQGDKLVECTRPSGACESCLSQCNAQIPTCLASADCRRALASYRTCQSGDCKDPTGTCVGCLEGNRGSSCFARCAEACSGSELISLCDIYCSCMKQNCQPPGASRAEANCVTDCMTRPPVLTNCQLGHCELAPALSEHCVHAVDDTGNICPTQARSNPSCTDKALVGYVCSNHSDCCSAFCMTGQCTADPTP